MIAKGLEAEGGLTARLAECQRGLTQTHADLLAVELLDLMEAASEGTLTIETAEDAGQVRVMRIADRVLEIRFSRRRGRRGVQLTRLYFTEPTHEGGVLLALALEWKPDGREGLTVQDEQVLVAEERIDGHYRKR